MKSTRVKTSLGMSCEKTPRKLYEKDLIRIDLIDNYSKSRKDDLILIKEEIKEIHNNGKKPSNLQLIKKSKLAEQVEVFDHARECITGFTGQSIEAYLSKVLKRSETRQDVVFWGTISNLLNEIKQIQ